MKQKLCLKMEIECLGRFVESFMSQTFLMELLHQAEQAQLKPPITLRTHCTRSGSKKNLKLSICNLG